MTSTTAPTSTSAYADVNGLHLYYEIHGELHGEARDDQTGGAPIVLLHGGLLTIDLTFASVLPALAAEHRVIAVELQGHGHTADTEREPSLANHAADVVALLDHLGIDKADFFGFSLGGLVSMEVVTSYPERVGRLIVAATHFHPSGYYAEISDPAMTSPRLPTAEDFGAMMASYAAVAPDPTHFQEFAARLQPVVHGFAGWTPDQLRAIASPTLIIIGDFDFVRPEHALEMQSLIPGAQLAILPGTSHSQLTGRAEIVPMLDRFLATA